MRKSTAIMLFIELMAGWEPLADERMHVINDSVDTLWFYDTAKQPLPDKNPFQKTSHVGGLPDTNDRGVDGHQLLPHENKVMPWLGKWDSVLANPYSDSSITFFTFSTQTVRTTS